jgi:hypothetical protein
MNENSSDVLARWAKLYFIIAIIISGFWTLSVLGALSFGEKLSLRPIVILALLVWGVWISYLAKLRATSSILAAILSMSYLPAGILVLTTPGPVRFFGLIPLAFAVFLYLYSTKTWAAHEHFWLGESKRKAESHNAS